MRSGTDGLLGTSSPVVKLPGVVVGLATLFASVPSFVSFLLPIAASERRVGLAATLTFSTTSLKGEVDSILDFASVTSL